MAHLLRFFLLFCLVLIPQATVGAPALPEGFRLLGSGQVSAVSDGDTLSLSDEASGREVVVRLVGIMAPKLPLGRAGFRPWPRGVEAKAALEELVLGKTVEIWVGETIRDRHGRILAHVVRPDDGLWVQGAMLQSGFARVYSFADNRMGVAAMYALEREARAAARGLWSHPDYAVLMAAQAEKAVRSFAVIEGRVLTAAGVGSRLYLNFGEDWRRDFTIKVERAARRLFNAEGLDLTAFQGRLIRVRGWVKWENGPMIEVSHPEQLEFPEGRIETGAKETQEP